VHTGKPTDPLGSQGSVVPMEASDAAL